MRAGTPYRAHHCSPVTSQMSNLAGHDPASARWNLFPRVTNTTFPPPADPTPNGPHLVEPEAGTPANAADLTDQYWLMSLLRPTLIAVASVALVLALVAFIRRLVPELPGVYTELLAVVGAVAAIVGCITTTWLAQPGQRGQRSAGYRAAEIILILGVTRIGIWLTTDSFPGLEAFLVRPMDALLDGYFLVGALVVGLAWIMATSMTEDLLAMALQPDDLYTVRTFADRWQDTARPVYTDRGAILRRFVARWVIGGILMIILAAGSRYDLPESGFLGIIRQNIDPVVVTGIILYFLAGLVLISQGQLALLRARWALQKTPSNPSIRQNWPVYALLIILLVGIVAALLPLGGTFYLAQIISAVLAAIYYSVFAIFRFFLSIFLVLLAWMSGEEAAPPPPMPTPEPPAVFEPPPASEALLPAWTGGIFFWAIAAALLGYAAYIYFSGKGNNWLWARRLWALLQTRWAALFGAYQSWQAARVRAEAERAAAALRGQGRNWPDWLRLRNLDPDRQVRYYYLALLHRAEEAGIPRKEAETPLHYAPRLVENAHLDEPNREAIQELTDAFIEVRYAGTHVENDRLARLKAVWRQLQRYFKL